MPFDQTITRTPMIDLMDRVISKIDAPEKWCKDKEVDWEGRHCIIGAFRVVSQVGEGSRSRLLKRQVKAKILELYQIKRCSVPMFNDRRATTHADVMRVLHAVRDDLVAQALVDV